MPGITRGGAAARTPAQIQQPCAPATAPSAQSGTFTAPPPAVIALAPGLAAIAGKFAALNAGAAPGSPPRGVV